MKVVKNILSIFLVLTVLNTFVGKTIHELFFHHHHHSEAQCEAKTSQHFHEQEAPSTDLVCSFNFSASLVSNTLSFTKVVLNELTNRNIVRIKIAVTNLYLKTKSLRAPPVF